MTISILSSNEDAATKMLRLLANLATEEEEAVDIFDKEKEKVREVLQAIVDALKAKDIEKNEEFVLNAICCVTNIVFYDTQRSPMLDNEFRTLLYQNISPFLSTSTNEEIQVEAVRVLSNLSRHKPQCQSFATDSKFVKNLAALLDSSLRDLVYYAIGIFINLSLHEDLRPEVVQKCTIQKLIEVLKDSNIEDFDLSKVSAKALLNLTMVPDSWSQAHVAALNPILDDLGEEIDSILDVANEEEQEEIMGLRQLINALINNMPEPIHACPASGCGRSFKSEEQLTEHVERRHKELLE